jgi:hypothetical protein
MFRIVPPAILFAALFLTLSSNAASQENNRPRPVAQPKSEAQRLQWKMQAQADQLDRMSATLNRYWEWFGTERRNIEGMRGTLQSLKSRSDTVRRSWNTRLNPTCDNGLTYASCGCNNGLRGKAQMRDVISRAEQQEGAQRTILNKAVGNYNKNADRYRELVQEMQQERRAFDENVETLKRMINAESKPPKGIPDSLGEIEKRAREQNK